MTFDVRMKGFKELISLNEALNLILTKIPFDSIEHESLDIRQSLGRILAEDVIAPIDVPPFDRSAVDGFAVRSEDIRGASTKNPVILRIKGSVYAGHSFEYEIGPLECVYITTGAPIPKGADAVVMIENTKQMGDQVEIYSPISKYGNVSLKGEDIKKGSAVLKKGHRIRPVDIGVLASLNICTVNVKKRPKVVIFTSGEELVEPCSTLPPGKIVETHLLMFSKYLELLGVEPISLGIIPDDESKIVDVLKTSLQKADLIITTGGSSVGKHDLTLSAIKTLENSEIVFHGVGIQPGKPTLFAMVDDKPILGLPGFPVSSFFAFIYFVKTAILHMLGVRTIHRRYTYATLTRRVSSKLGIVTLVRVKLIDRDGELFAEPIRAGGSTVLTSISGADGYFEIPEDMEGFEKGTRVKVYYFDDVLR